MRSRFGRLGVVLLACVSVVAVPAQPARATSVYTASFIGQMQLAGPGLGYMCTNDTGPAGTTTYGVDPTYLCADALVTGALVSTLPLGGGLPPNASVHFNHNTHGAAISSVVCAAGGTNVLKSAMQHPVDAGTCGFSAAGTISGGCDVNGGQLTGTFTATNVLGLPPQTFLVDIHFNSFLPEADGKLVMTGHALKLSDGQVGLVVGAADFNAPTPVLVPGQSCYNLTALTFLLSGQIAIVTT